MMHMWRWTGLVIFLVQSARCCWRLIFRHRAVLFCSSWVSAESTSSDSLRGLYKCQIIFQLADVCCYCERAYIQMMRVLLLSCALFSSCISTRTHTEQEHCKTHRDVCHLLVLLTLWKEPSTFNFLPAPSLVRRLFDLRARARDEKKLCIRHPLPFRLCFFRQLSLSARAPPRFYLRFGNYTKA